MTRTRSRTNAGLRHGALPTTRASVPARGLVAIGAAQVPGTTRPLRRRLAPDLHEALHRGERGEHEHDPQHRDEDVEREADAEEHDPLGALHEPAARVEAERLGPRPLVGDEHRERERPRTPARRGAGSRRRGTRRRRRGSAASATRSQTESKNAPRGLAWPLRARDRAVEDVGEPGEDDADDAEHEVAVGDERTRCRPRSTRPNDGEGVGGDPERGRRPSPTGSRPSLAPSAPASVEHVRTPRVWVSERRSDAARLSARRGARYHGAPRRSSIGCRARARAARDRRRVGIGSRRPRRGPRGVAGEDVPDGEDPQRRPGRPRRRRARPRSPRRSCFAAGRDHPPGQGRGRHHRHRLRPRGAAAAHLGVARARAVRARRPQGQRDRHARATPTSSATSPPRCGPPTSRCSSSPRSRASRCRPRSRGAWPRSAASRARSS